MLPLFQMLVKLWPQLVQDLATIAVLLSPCVPLPQEGLALI
jgi:hypothetical protein